MNGPVKQRSFSTMQILFNKTIEQCRQLGARGGRAYGRNRRLRQSQAPIPPVVQLPPPPSETVHQACLRLDPIMAWPAVNDLPVPLQSAVSLTLWQGMHFWLTNGG